MGIVLARAMTAETAATKSEEKRLVTSVPGRNITVNHLDASIRAPRQDFTATPSPESPQTLPGAVERLERRLIEEAMRESGGKKQKAAQALGLSRQWLIKKMKRLGIRVKNKRAAAYSRHNQTLNVIPKD